MALEPVRLDGFAMVGMGLPLELQPALAGTIAQVEIRVVRKFPVGLEIIAQ